MTLLVPCGRLALAAVPRRTYLGFKAGMSLQRELQPAIEYM
jgi:hypothetical protein